MATKPVQTDLLSIEEAAVMMGVSSATVRRRIAQGLLSPVREGKRIVLPREEVARLSPLPNGPKPERRKSFKGQSFGPDDPFWDIVGIGPTNGPTDVSQNKHKYLAEAYADRHDSSERL